MEPDVGELPFEVELKLQLSQLSFGKYDGLGIMSTPSDFSEFETLRKPVFSGGCFFGRNNLGTYHDGNFGINCQRHGYEEARISDGILGSVHNTDRNTDRADYSFAVVYAEDEICAQVDIYLIPNIFEKIYMAKNTVNFQLATSFNEHKKITEDEFEGRDRKPDNIIVEGEPGRISTTNKFTLDIGEKEFGYWFFRVRLVSLGFPPAESPPAESPPA